MEYTLKEKADLLVMWSGQLLKVQAIHKKDRAAANLMEALVADQWREILRLAYIGLEQEKNSTK